MPEARVPGPVSFRLHDVRADLPAGPFDLVPCRNLAFTYFAEDSQRSVAGSLYASLRPGGALVVGTHEEPPEGLFEPWLPRHGVWRRRKALSATPSRRGALVGVLRTPTSR